MRINKEALDMIKAEKRLTNKEIISRAGVGTNILSVGIKRELRPATVGKIAKALNVSVEEIIQRNDIEEPLSTVD